MIRDVPSNLGRPSKTRAITNVINPPINSGIAVRVKVSKIPFRAIPLPNKLKAVKPIRPTAMIANPWGSPGWNPPEKKIPLPMRDKITPRICQLVGISFKNSTAPASTRRGIKLINKEPVVAGIYFKPQNKAPFPSVYELIPIKVRRIQREPDILPKSGRLINRKGSRITNPRKYRKPAIVRGPREFNPILTITKVDDQIRVTINASRIARHFGSTFDVGIEFLSGDI
jgi:hypothetical protein